MHACVHVCVCVYTAGVGHPVRQGIRDQARDQQAVCRHLPPREDHSLQPQEHQKGRLRYRQRGTYTQARVLRLWLCLSIKYSSNDYSKANYLTLPTVDLPIGGARFSNIKNDYLIKCYDILLISFQAIFLAIEKVKSHRHPIFTTK